ncbi:winged helix-turn-helix transcriptional regulator, partial [Streptomyces sp. NPDC057747]
AEQPGHGRAAKPVRLGPLPPLLRPGRPGELRERIGGISPKVLTETLRRLESNGLVERHAYAESPPRVEYELTAPGPTLLGPIGAFGAWAFERGDEVMAAQDRNSA